MLSPFGVFTTYSVLYILTPIIVTTTSGIRTDLLSLFAYHLNLHYRFNKVEPVMLCVGLVTLYIYVVIELITDLVKAVNSGDRYTLNGGTSYSQFEHARRQSREMFPPFIVSSFLIYANTTKFDAFRNSLITLQAVVILAYPITVYISTRSNAADICKYMYHSVLFWTLLYALFPRETSQYIQHVVELITQVAFGRGSYNNGYRNTQQWIF